MILITGGSSSGKSAFAEQVACGLDSREKLYIATMLSRGKAGAETVARHRSLREGKGFATLEKPFALGRIEEALPRVVLLECLSTWLANEMFEPDGYGAACTEEMIADVLRLRQRCSHLLIVTSEVFSDGVTYDPDTEEYLRCLGLLNQRLAKEAEAVVEVVCGIPVYRKGSIS